MYVLPIDISSHTYFDAADLNTIFTSIETYLNGNIENSGISALASIDPVKVAQGGAVTVNELSNTGTPDKIPKYDTLGNLVCSGLKFTEGLA
jgi:hypothetical protein